MNERKGKEHQAHINDLQEKDSTNAITQISRMQRLRLRRTNGKNMNGRPLNHLHFTAHVSNTCKDESSWRPDPVFFACPEEMHGALRQALEKAPIRKAAGVDKLKNRNAQIDIETSTKLLFELWAACGRCGNLPQE